MNAAGEFEIYRVHVNNCPSDPIIYMIIEFEQRSTMNNLTSDQIRKTPKPQSRCLPFNFSVTMISVCAHSHLE